MEKFVFNSFSWVCSFWKYLVLGELIDKLEITIRDIICDQRFNSLNELHNQVLGNKFNHKTPVLQILIAKKVTDSIW